MPLTQRTLTFPIGNLPSEIQYLILNFFSIPTLTMLCSVSKNLSTAINGIKSFEDAKLFIQNYIKTNQISSLNKAICIKAGVLHQEHLEVINRLNILDLPFQNLLELLLNTDPNDTKTQSITQFVNQIIAIKKYGLLLSLMLLCFSLLSLATSIYGKHKASFLMLIPSLIFFICCISFYYAAYDYKLK